MRHDYELPPDWDSMSPEERNVWMTQERCYRQVMSQNSATADDIQHAADRVRRRGRAVGYDDLDYWR